MPDEGASLSSEFSEADLLSDIEAVLADLDPVPSAVRRAAKDAFSQKSTEIDETLRLERDEADAFAGHRRLVFDGDRFAAVVYTQTVTDHDVELVCVLQPVRADDADVVAQIVPSVEYQELTLPSSSSGKVHQWAGLVTGPVRLSFLDPDEPAGRSATEWFIL